MKYNEKNKPLQCMQTQSRCYKNTSKMTVRGVLWHDTAAGNPYIKRYVQPSDDAPDKDEWLEILGVNQYHNDWNHVERSAGLNCWVGKLADETVTTVQSMPWDYAPWGCGAGSKGSCNDGWVQFEICDDGYKSKEYFEKCYKEACEITAYICKLYNLNPKGTVTYKGQKVPVILCHYDSYKYGLGCNHGDVYGWFGKYGKTMDDVRNDVAALMGAQPEPTQNTYPGTFPTLPARGYFQKGDKGVNVKRLQDFLLWYGCTLPKYGADSSYGAETESAVKSFQKSEGLTPDGLFGKDSLAAAKKATKPTSKYKAGDTVRLTMAQAYATSEAKEAAKTLTGTYYVWSAETVNNRIRVTTKKEYAGKKAFITAWIEA